MGRQHPLHLDSDSASIGIRCKPHLYTGRRGSIGDVYFSRLDAGHRQQV